jgi:outer membrane protein insertion porin family
MTRTNRTMELPVSPAWRTRLVAVGLVAAWALPVEHSFGQSLAARPARQMLIEGHNTVPIWFFVGESPNLVREIRYKNAHHMSYEKLEAITGLKHGLPLDPERNRHACELIVEDYRKQGRIFASCVLEEGGQPGDQRVVFNIDEGPIPFVSNVAFTGNDNLAVSAPLQAEIKDGLCGQVRKFNPERCLEETLKLEKYYRENGYLDARVTRELIFSEDHSSVEIVYHIVDGPRYHVQEVTVKGTAVLPSEQVTSILKLQKGDLYNDKVVQADVRNITDLYGYRGYPAAVSYKLIILSRFPDPDLVQVQYEITEKTPFRCGGNIIITPRRRDR